MVWKYPLSLSDENWRSFLHFLSKEGKSNTLGSYVLERLEVEGDRIHLGCCIVQGRVQTTYVCTYIPWLPICFYLYISPLCWSLE
jgi:hypothetical protein